jgi:hypothetical protein
LEASRRELSTHVGAYLDHFEGNCYTSDMIPIVVRIQNIFRNKRAKRKQEEERQR